MAKRRKAFEPPALPDGYYWFCNFTNLSGGGHVDAWKMAQAVAGKVRLIGSGAEWEQDCEYFRNAVWVRIDPPHVEAGDTATPTETAVRRGNRVARVSGDDRHRLRQRIRIVADGIVDAFTETHDSTAAYYDRRPEERGELVAQIERLIERVRE